MVPLIYTFDWFKRDKNFTTSNKEMKLNWENGLNDKFSSFLYNMSKVNMLLSKKPELIDELCGIGINFGINKRRILINDKNENSYTNNKSIVVSTKFKKEINNLYDKLDLIIGLFCHECAHCLYSDFKNINKSNRIIKWLQNVIEDELIESKLGQKYPGYINFISKVKYYYFDTLKEDILNGNDKNHLDKIMKIFLLVIRYPKYLNEIPERELIEYADLFDKIYDILKSNMCLNPDRNEMCTTMSFNSAKQIYELIKKFIETNYPEKVKKNKKSSKKNNAPESLGSKENEEDFNDSSNESDSDYSESSDENSGEDSEENDSDNDYSSADSEDSDEDNYSDDDYEDSDDDNSSSKDDDSDEIDLEDLEDDEENNNTTIKVDSDEDTENKETVDSEEKTKSESEDETDEESDENSEGSSKTSFEEMEDEVNNDEDSVKNLYDKVQENIESSSESEEDIFSSSIDMENDANNLEKEYEIEERESLNIEIKDDIHINEISNYNEVYNLIRPYITFAKQMIIQNDSSDVLNIERFRRNGMLDTRKIAEAYMGCNNVFTQNIQRKKKNQNSRYALVIMLDESGSMSYNKIFDFTTQLAVLIYETVKLYKDMEIFIYGHGDYVIPYITKNKIEKEVLASRRIQGDQDEPTSYRTIIEDVKKQTNLPIIAVNITDAFYCYSPESIKEVVREYKKQHVDINLICCSEATSMGSVVYNMNNEIYGQNHWISLDQLGNKFKSSMKILGDIISRNYNS